jgi:hypothetical protein
MQIGDIIPFHTNVPSRPDGTCDAKLIRFWENSCFQQFCKFEWVEGPYDGETFDVLRKDLDSL